MTDADVARIRKAYDEAVERHAAQLPPAQAMTYRHACGLAWNHADVLTLAKQAAEGTISFWRLLTELRPYVRQALAEASPVATPPKRLH